MEGARLEFLMGSRSTISYYTLGFESAPRGWANFSGEAYDPFRASSPNEATPPRGLVCTVGWETDLT